MDYPVCKKVRTALLEKGDAKTRESAKRFFKETVAFHGLKAAQVRSVAAEYYKTIKDQGKDVIFTYCESLLQTNKFEEKLVGLFWLDKQSKAFEEQDFAVLAKWLNRYVDNWAICDTLCNHAIGSFVMKFPEKINDLFAWTASKNRWVRRGSAVSLIIPARKGLFLAEILKIADTLLLDDDDMVQKGYGWMLKEASKPHCTQIFDFVMKRKATMPRTALRYAIEKMPANLKKAAMAK